MKNEEFWVNGGINRAHMYIHKHLSTEGWTR